MILTSTDQMGDRLELRRFPERIVSLVPSLTELLVDLGLEDRIVGVTKFCIHPHRLITSKTVVGGTKNFYFDIIEQLRPDLIIGNKEENYEDGISFLRKTCPVWMSDIFSIDDALKMIRSISLITGSEPKGIEIINRIETAFNSLKPIPNIPTLYLMWRKPWMAAANQTFIHTMMEKIGLGNVLSAEDRYPEISAERIKLLNPALILLSSEPFPFIKKHINEIAELLPKARIQLVDGEMFSWYGSRLILAPAYFNALKFGV